MRRLPPLLPLLRTPLVALVLVSLASLLSVQAANAQLVYSNLARRSCLGTGTLVAPLDQQLSLTSMWAQLDQGQQSVGEKAHGVDLSTLASGPVYTQDGAVLEGTGDVLRLVMVGNTVQESEGYSNDTNLLSTLVLTSEVLTFEVATNSSWLCSSIRTNEGTTGTTTNGTLELTDSGCPYSGEIALGVTIPLASSYPLTTITTNLVALDPSNPALHLACYDVSFTPYYPDYFAYPLIRYLVIGLLALFLLLYVLARIYASYTTWLSDNEAELASSLSLKLSTPHGGVSRRKMYGAVWFGAWAGKQVVASGSLRRYATAEVREIFQMVAWFSLVGTVAVAWPGFAYPVFAQTAWTALVYNNTLSFTSPADPVLPENATLPTPFASQISDTSSPLYLDTSLSNVLLDLDSSADGIERWARMVGVRHEDLWSICAFTFLSLCAGVIAAHLVFFAFDSALDAVFPKRRSAVKQIASVEDKDGLGNEHDDPSSFSLGKEHGLNESYGSGSAAGRPSDASAGRYLGSGDFLDDEYLDGSGDHGRPGACRGENAFPSWKLHLALLQGNLTRVLLLFHLPLSLFSAYQFSLYSSAPISTFALAVVLFALVCVAWPAYLLFQIHVKSVRELYTRLPTLLSLGVLYNTYSEECTQFAFPTFVSNLVVGVVIGAVQGTGTAQAAVILIVEVAHTLITSLWLPWGDNSAMGALAFLLSLARIIIAVLLVVLSPTVNISASAASWIAYIVFLVQGLVLLLLVFVAAFKLLELLVRVIGGVPFDESRSPRGGGLFGAIRKIRGGKGGGKNRRRQGGGGGAQSSAAKRRAIEERRRRNLHRERFGTGASDRSSVQARTHMLPSAARPAGHSALSLNGGGSNSPFPSAGLDDNDYIMSAMSSRGWDSASEASSQRPGFVKPGSYAAASSGPILRSVQQHWGHSQVSMSSSPTPTSAIIVPAAAQTSSPPSTGSGGSGFTRVGGGRASHSNPYQQVSPPSSSPNAYPPYPPSSSADIYGSPSSGLGVPPSNLRRNSQSAIVELANTSPGHSPNYIGGTQTRPSLSLPSSSALLSNSVSPAGGRGRLDDAHNRRPSARVRARQANQGGFFGRFKKQRAVEYSDEELTDETDTDEENVRPKKGGWGALAGAFGGGKRKGRTGGGYSSAEDEPAPSSLKVHEEEPAEKGFSVVRKPRPRPSPSAATATSSDPLAASQQPIATDFAASPPNSSVPGTPTTATQGPSDPLLATVDHQQPLPHVSVEAPSRPGSIREEGVEGVVGEWEVREGEAR
ncbi:hypothetical protein JCM8547_006542 [Rhodosporidiobolus lusitaniae]